MTENSYLLPYRSIIVRVNISIGTYGIGLGDGVGAGLGGRLCGTDIIYKNVLG